MLNPTNQASAVHQHLVQATMYVSVLLTTTCLLLPPFASSTSSSSSLALSPPSLSSSDNLSSTSDNHDSTHHYNETRLFSHFKEPYTYRLHGKLSIGVGESTTSSIKLTWHLSNRTYTDSVIESQVICETFFGTIVSRKIVSQKGSHRIEGLDSDSRYILCVYMLEKSALSNVTILHFNCHKAATIPVLRADSIIGVMLTLGYIFLMAAIGYFVWRKKSREVNEDKIRIHVDDDEEEDDDEEDSLRPSLARSDKRKTSASKNSIEKRNDSIGALNPVADTGNARFGSGDLDGTNGRLEFSKSRESPPTTRLCGLAQAEMEDRRPTSNSRNVEDSPVKVTEIAF